MQGLLMQAPEPRLVLASQSAARAGLLTAAGLDFAARPARIDEAAVKQSARAEGLPAPEVALLLAGLKAERVRAPEALVIGADQLLVAGDDWYDKPADRQAARAQLLALRGREHVLVTAVVCHRGGQEVWRHVAQPRLRMRAFTEAFLDRYLDQEGKAVLDCVGAYRLEGLGMHLFEAIGGEHSAILGLPMLPLLEFLRQHGVLAR